MKISSTVVPTSVSLYSPEKVGISMEAVGTDFIQMQEKEIQTKWFRSHETETDIFVWYDSQGKTIKQQVIHMGVVVEWNILDGVRTGILFDTEIQPAVKNTQTGEEASEAVSESIQYDNIIQRQCLITALEIVKHSKCIDGDLRANLFRNFSQESIQPDRGGFLNMLLKFILGRK